MEIKEIESKSILTPSQLPDADYVVNPYTGCAFGCIYCYASFMGRFVGKSNDEWGEYVFVKTNAPELLIKDLKKLKDKGKGKSILLSSVTDPYQGMEAKYELTRKCLQVLLDYEYEGLLSILTKSHMILRDVDLLKQLKHVDIGLTITSTDDGVSRFFEKKAPNVSQRLEALTVLNKEGINTYAFVGPLLPHYVADPQKLDKLLGSIKDAGTNEIYVEHINLSKYILSRLKKEAADMDKEIMDKFYQSQDKGYREELDTLIKDLAGKHGLKIRLDEPIFHQGLGK
jgi:DNA repair photolyase